MKIIFYMLAVILLSSCAKEDINLDQEEKTLAPLEITQNDYDSFFLNGSKYSLPMSYEDFRNSGISLNEDEFYYKKINKNSQSMANLKGDGVDIGATFKNDTQEAIDIENATIIETYINNMEGKNKDFSINGLSWGDSYQKAKKSLKDLNTAEAGDGDDKTINYNTDKNYVSLYFDEDKLSSVAIFSKRYMRDESYRNGEFVVFGQTVKFPFTINHLEELLFSSVDIDASRQILEANEELGVRVYSPLFGLEDKANSGIDFKLKNTSQSPIPIKEAQVVSLVSDSSSDLSVGNLYVGASIDELKIVDKKNQKPVRLSIEGKVDGNLYKFVFRANNDTSYIYYADSELIRRIEIVNTKE